MLHSMIIDDFLDDYPIIRGWADTAEYENSTNPYDGLEYHGIAKNSPGASILRSLQRFFHPGVRLTHHLARLSTQGAPVPYQAHADAFMGASHSVVIYLNRPEHCKGGTSILKHKNGATKEADPDWKKDESNPDAWEVLFTCPMVTNRAFIYRSDLLHRSDPLGGFGTYKHDGRLVLVAMFDL